MASALSQLGFKPRDKLGIYSANKAGREGFQYFGPSNRSETFFSAVAFGVCGSIPFSGTGVQQHTI